MPSTPDTQSTRIELVPASPEQEPILANLLEFYIHDFSEFYPMDPGPDGRFGYPNLSAYWSHPDRYPFLIEAGGKLAGLVLVKKDRGVASVGPVWDIAEFFILRAWRRKGIGTGAAHQAWERFPGEWELRAMQSNRNAVEFWQRAIAGFTGAAIKPALLEKGGVIWQVFRFESKPAAKE